MQPAARFADRRLAAYHPCNSPCFQAVSSRSQHGDYFSRTALAQAARFPERPHDARHEEQCTSKRGRIIPGACVKCRPGADALTSKLMLIAPNGDVGASRAAPMQERRATDSKKRKIAYGDPFGSQRCLDGRNLHRRSARARTVPRRSCVSTKPRLHALLRS